MNLLNLLSAALAGGPQNGQDPGPQAQDVWAKALGIPIDQGVNAPIHSPNEPQRTSSFKPKHGLSLFLANVGDALAESLGGTPEYKTRKDNYDIAQAMSNPDSPDYARMAEINPAFAEKVYEGRALAGYRNGMIDARNRGMDLKALGQTGRVLAATASMAAAANKETWPAMRENIAKLWAGAGMDPSVIPTEYDPDQISGIVENLGMSLYQKQQLALGRDRFGESQRHNYVSEKQNQQKVDSYSQDVNQKGALIPSTINRNNAQAGNYNAQTDRVYQRNGAAPYGSPQLGVPTLPPPPPSNGGQAGLPKPSQANGQKGMLNGVRMITKNGQWVKAVQGVDY